MADSITLPGHESGTTGMGLPQPTAQMLDPSFAQEPPPKAPVPAVDSLGLEEFQKYMSPNSFDTFITLMHFAVHQQEIFEGVEMEWGPEKVALAVAPFVGFGNPVMWENAYRHPMRERILPIILRWNRKGAKFQKKNPLPWMFLEYLACDFAQAEKGHQNALAMEEILQDEDFQNKWRRAR